MSCCFANADTILTVEYFDGNEKQEQLEKLSKIVFDKNGNITFDYNSGDTRDFGNVSNTRKIIFSEGVLSQTDNLSSETPIRIYPNPAAETISIVGMSDGESARIYTLSGTLVLTSQSSEINVGTLANGQYLVVVGNSISKLIKK